MLSKKNDDLEQEKLLDSLVFFGVQHNHETYLGSTVLNVIQRMGVSSVSSMHILG